MQTQEHNVSVCASSIADGNVGGYTFCALQRVRSSLAADAAAADHLPIGLEDFGLHMTPAVRVGHAMFQS